MSSRPLKIYFGTLAVLLIVGGLFAYRPAVVVGVDAANLSRSVSAGDLPCEQTEDEIWSCPRVYPGPDSIREYRVNYRVEVDGMGCWTADRIGTAGSDAGVEAHLTGCINALDL